MENSPLSRQKLKLYIGFTLLVIFLIVIIYVTRVQLIPDPGKNLLSDFAIYFSNLLMPVLTLATVIALLSTLYFQQLQLKEQKIQFLKQEYRQFFESYIHRFDFHYSNLEKMLKMDLPISVFTTRPIKLEDSKYGPLAPYELDPDKIAKVIKNEIVEAQKTNGEPSYLKIYIADIQSELKSLVYALKAANSFGQDEDILNLLELKYRADIMIGDMESWKIISKAEEYNLHQLLNFNYPEKNNLGNGCTN